MRKVIFFAFASMLLASCGGARPSGYIVQNKETIYKRPSKSPRPTATRERKFNSEPIAVNDTYGQDEGIPDELNLGAPDVEFIKKMDIIDYAKSFQGTRYRFGGTTSAGMDCSGLVCTAFEKEEISLPRSSRDMAKQGLKIHLREVEPGDLVFFKTSRKDIINHVGLVVEAADGRIQFIHSTTQAGVIISSLDEPYWKKSFVEVRRMI